MEIIRHTKFYKSKIKEKKMIKEILIITGLIIFGATIINPISQIDGFISLGLYYWSTTLVIATILLFYRIWADFDYLEEAINEEIKNIKKR